MSNSLKSNLKARQLNDVWVYIDCKATAVAGGYITITGYEHFYGCSHVTIDDVYEACS